MNIKRIITPLLLIILLSFMVAFGTNVPLGPYFDDTYFDLSDSALILKVVPHEKGGLEADVSAYDGLIKITGGATSNLTIGIGDDNIVEIDDADAAVNDYCKLTANGIVGREYSEVRTDLGLVIGTDVQAYSADNAFRTDKLSVFAATTSAELAGVISDEMGSGSLAFLPADPNADRFLMWDDAPTGELVWAEGGGGYTNLTSFVDQTAWRLFYSNTDGDVIELALGTTGQYLKSTGATSAPIFDTPTGAGDMLKATYDSDEDGDIDVAAGGTEKSSWTLYAIPYLSGTTAFGEIAIGTAEYALTVNAGANGYDWTLFDLSLYYLKTEIDSQAEMETIWSVTLLNDLVDDTTPEYGGTMDHNNNRDIEVKTVEFNGLYDNGNSGATPTIDWQNGNYQKIAVSENTLFTFSNAFIGTITLQITYSGAFTAGFNAGYTILEEGGIEISFTETNGAVDILKVMYLGTANNYVVGVMLDVKD